MYVNTGAEVATNVMYTISEQLFLVNGKESRLTVEPDSIVWRTVTVGQSSEAAIHGNNKSVTPATKLHDTDSRKIHSTTTTETKLKRLSFAQLIGTNQGRRCKSSKKKLKIYYAKDNEFKSTSRLLKIESLSIESIKTSPASSQNENQNNIDKDNRQQVTLGCVDTKEATSATETKSQQIEYDEGQLVSEPPSCYASDGGTSHLSSYSTCSSPVHDSAEPQSSSEYQQQQTLTSAEQPDLPVSLAEVCQLIEARIEQERQENRPRRLLVFVNPYGGKGKAVRLYKSKVRRLLDIANVETKLVVTKYANHARDTIEDPMFDVEYFDAVICIGGDGMFSELMNGLLFRYNRDRILAAKLVNAHNNSGKDQGCDPKYQQTESIKVREQLSLIEDNGDGVSKGNQRSDIDTEHKVNGSTALDLESLRSALGGIGQPLKSPPLPIGVIGAGSTDANSFGLIGTNDVVTATLNIILGKQIHIDICSVHAIENDRLLRFVSTFVAYGYFGDVIRESEKLRWLGPSRYDVTGLNNLLKNRAYQGRVRILISGLDGSPRDTQRCHTNCDLCKQLKECPQDSQLQFIERQGSFVGVNAAVTACRCPQTRKGFSPNNHLANGCVDLILVRPCSRMQYVRYLLRTGFTKKSAFDLKYIETYRCRQFEFLADHDRSSGSRNQLSSRALGSSSGVSSSSSSAISSLSASNSSSFESKARANNTSPSASIDNTLLSSWNVDGEILDEPSIRVKVNNRLLRVFGTGEPTFSITY